jgi:hypothetical protein
MDENKESWTLPCFSEKGSAFVKNGIEIRCPGKFKKLFLVLIQEHMPEPGTYMEIACADCAKFARANGAPGTKRFLHYYDTTGICVTSKATTS